MPNFFLVGAPKAGTTALYRYLDQHPAIYMSPIKEPNFFADELRLDNFTPQFRKQADSRLPAQQEYLRGSVSGKLSGGPIPEWTDYLKLFQNVHREIAIGEASVCYLWSKSAPKNIASRFPDAKILMVLRNPIERAFTQYAHMLTFASARITFREYMGAATQSTSTLIGELYPFLNFGLYYEQVKRYQSIFDAAQIQIHFYEDFHQDPQTTLRAIFQFLSVDPDFKPDFATRHMEARVPVSFFMKNALKRLGIRLPKSVRRQFYQPRSTLALTPADRARLIDYYRDDITNLSQLLHRDLTPWLN